jgi:hypothetical protein
MSTEFLELSVLLPEDESEHPRKKRTPTVANAMCKNLNP